MKATNKQFLIKYQYSHPPRGVVTKEQIFLDSSKRGAIEQARQLVQKNLRHHFKLVLCLEENKDSDKQMAAPILKAITESERTYNKEEIYQMAVNQYGQKVVDEIPTMMVYLKRRVAALGYYTKPEIV